MGTTANDVSSILAASPLENHLSTSDANMLSVDLSETGQYLAMVVEELRVLREAIRAIAARLDDIGP